MGLVPLYTGRFLLLLSGELCDPLPHVLSPLFYTVVFETFSFSLPPLSHFFPSKTACFPVLLGHPMGVPKEICIGFRYHVGLLERLTLCFILSLHRAHSELPCCVTWALSKFGWYNSYEMFSGVWRHAFTDIHSDQIYDRTATKCKLNSVSPSGIKLFGESWNESDIDLFSVNILGFLSIETLGASPGDKRRTCPLTFIQHRCLECPPCATRSVYCFSYVEYLPLTTQKS